MADKMLEKLIAELKKGEGLPKKGSKAPALPDLPEVEMPADEMPAGLYDTPDDEMPAGPYPYDTPPTMPELPELPELPKKIADDNTTTEMELPPEDAQGVIDNELAGGLPTDNPPLSKTQKIMLSTVGGIGALGTLGAGTVVGGAYPTLAGKRIYDQISTDPDLAYHLKSELENAKSLDFSRTAERGAEILGQNIVQPEASNLLGSLAKAVTGGIKGVLGGGRNILGITDTAIGDILGAVQGRQLNPKNNINDKNVSLADSPTVQLLGLIAGVSNKSDAASAISQGLFGKDITGQELGIGGNIEQIFLKPWETLKPDEKAFVQSNWDTYLKYKATYGSGGLDKETWNIGQALKKDFEIVSKDYRSAADSYSALKNVNTEVQKIKGTSPTKNQTVAIGYQFMKTLDPSSTVRESEFANLGDAEIATLSKLPVVGELLAALARQARGGGAYFNKASAQELMDIATQSFRARANGFRPTYEQYKRNAGYIPNVKVEDLITVGKPEYISLDKDGNDFWNGIKYVTPQENNGGASSNTTGGPPSAVGIPPADSKKSSAGRTENGKK